MVVFGTHHCQQCAIKSNISVISQSDNSRMAFAPSGILALMYGYSQWENFQKRRDTVGELSRVEN
jgi:hypothetical protein